MSAATAGSYHLMLKSLGENEIDLSVSVGVTLFASAAGYTLRYFGNRAKCTQVLLIK